MIDDAVMLASENGDYGLVRLTDAREQAQQLANEEDMTITIRNWLTDEIIDTVAPKTDSAAWLPKCYWGSVDNPPPHPSEVTDEDPDDTLLAVTPPDVIAMLGFDPLELEDDAISSLFGSDMTMPAWPPSARKSRT